MLDAGGYWRPLAAVARLLEELAELFELLGASPPPREELAGELADLWIITAALADQFRIAVREPGSRRAPAAELPASRAGELESDPASVVIAAGQIARVVNYYDGPKTPRGPGSLPSLRSTIEAFHERLAGLCDALELELGEAVASKLAAIRAGGDMSRFARDDSDPSTAAVLELLGDGGCAARLWGAPAPGAGPTAGGYGSTLAPSLLAFTKAAASERLGGYLIGAPAPPGSAELDGWLTQLLNELRLADPGERAPAQPASGRFSFNGVELSVSVLAVEDGAAARIGTRAEALVLLSPSDGLVLARPSGDRP